MKVNNECSFPVIALCVHENHGFGKEELINTSDSKEVVGPFIGEMGGGRCNLIVQGEITCHENPDDDSGYQVLDKQPLILGGDKFEIIVRHHSNELPKS